MGLPGLSPTFHIALRELRCKALGVTCLLPVLRNAISGTAKALLLLAFESEQSERAKSCFEPGSSGPKPERMNQATP